MVTASNLLMTAEAARRIGPFSPLRYLHDCDFMFRMLTRFPGRVVYEDGQKLLYYRIHGDNTLQEAAIIGRQQDQELIRKYMLDKVPDQFRRYVEAGSDRLIELERELYAVRRQLNRDETMGIKRAGGSCPRQFSWFFIVLASLLSGCWYVLREALNGYAR